MGLIGELFGSDPYTQKMRALSEIRRCGASLSAIVGKGLIDRDFDKQRADLNAEIKELCDRIYAEAFMQTGGMNGEITYGLSENAGERDRFRNCVRPVMPYLWRVLADVAHP